MESKAVAILEDRRRCGPLAGLADYHRRVPEAQGSLGRLIRGGFDFTGRSRSALLCEAGLTEAPRLRLWVPGGEDGEPWPCEHAPRSYPLAAQWRGSKNNDQPDRRILWEVLDRMRFSKQGIHQLARALTDFAAGEPIRAVDENGAVKQRPNNLGDLIVNDVYLRDQFRARGQVSAKSGGKTPGEQLKDRIVDLSGAMNSLEEAFKAVVGVTGLDGGPLVAELGVDPEFASERRKLLSLIGDELHIWSRTFRQRHGVVTTPTLSRDAEEEEEDERDAPDDPEVVDGDEERE